MHKGVRDSRFDGAGRAAPQHGPQQQHTPHGGSALAALELQVAKELWHVGRDPTADVAVVAASRSRFFAARAAALQAPRHWLQMELCRRDAFAAMSESMKDLMQATVDDGPTVRLVSAHDLHELPCRWAMQHAAEMPDFAAERSHVTVRDMGQRVRVASLGGATGVVQHVSSMNGGEYWVRVVLEGSDRLTAAPPPAGQAPGATEDEEASVEAEQRQRSGDARSDTAAAAEVALPLASSSPPLPPGATRPGTAVQVEREDVQLVTPALLFPDPLMPADDGTPRGTSGCIALAATLGLNTLAASMPHGERAAIADCVSLAVAAAARQHRQALWATHGALVAREAHAAAQPPHGSGATMTLSDSSDEVRITVQPDPLEQQEQQQQQLSPVSLCLLQRTAVKLAHLYRCWGPAAGDIAAAEGQDDQALLALAAANDGFVARLGAMLLRYDALFGPHGRNQGPQAAVPPTVLHVLHETFHVTAECFASPLNAQFGTFCSLFPDTDGPFGCLGSFFDVEFRSGAYEVNPPFDTKLLWSLHNRLQKLLASAQTRGSALLFFIIVPCHLQPMAGRKRSRPDGTGGNAMAEQPPRQTPLGAMLASPFCRGSLLCDAARTCFVDGHQHVLRHPYFTIGTDTQLLVLSSSSGSSGEANGVTAGLEKVRDAWYRILQPDDVR